MIEVRLGTNWYVLRIILLELSRQNFLSPVTVPPKITVRELHCGLFDLNMIKKFLTPVPCIPKTWVTPFILEFCNLRAL